MHSIGSFSNISATTLPGETANRGLLDHFKRHNLVEIVQHGVGERGLIRFSEPFTPGHDGVVTALRRRPERRRGIADGRLISIFYRRIRSLQITLRPFGDVARPFCTRSINPMHIVGSAVITYSVNLWSMTGDTDVA